MLENVFISHLLGQRGHEGGDDGGAHEGADQVDGAQRVAARVRDGELIVDFVLDLLNGLFFGREVEERRVRRAVVAAAALKRLLRDVRRRLVQYYK